MKGTVARAYRIPVDQWHMAMEHAPEGFSSAPSGDLLEFTVWYGDMDLGDAQELAASTLEAALTAAGVEFELSHHSVAFGDPLPFWEVSIDGLGEPMLVPAWSANEAVEIVRDLYPDGVNLIAFAHGGEKG